MIYTDLFNQVLIQPSVKSDNLYILSGYASPSFARTHLKTCPNIVIHLIIGMASLQGISLQDHNNFIDITNSFPGRFFCYYNTGKATHAKLYTWYNGQSPIAGFTGSANYSQNAFYELQNEIMEFSSPKEILNFWLSFSNQSISCTDPNVPNIIPLTTTPHIKSTTIAQMQKIVHTSVSTPATFSSVELTLTEQNSSSTPTKSGINWGQRAGRDPNQAYIAIPSKIYNTTFFPPIGIPFTLRTDDGFTYDCVRAQENGKALETTNNNSILGYYLRARLGVPSGSYVYTSDLDRYGRRTVTIYKINSSEYLMDFSV